MFRRNIVLSIGLLAAWALPRSLVGETPAVTPMRVATVRVRVILKEVVKTELERLRESPEYKRVEEEQGRQAMPSFRKSGPNLQREAAIYAKGYRQVQREIAAYCAAEYIDLVLNDNTPEEKNLEDSNRPSIYIGNYIGKDVVFANSGRDITEDIVLRVRKGCTR